MLKFGLLVALPLALGFMPTQSGYGTGSGSNGANSGINMANMNMGSSGTNARMSPNASNMGPQQQNHPSGSRNMIPGREFRDNLPYQCTMRFDRGYFCPYGTSTRRSYAFNSYTGRCEPFFYLGCGGNRNRFSDKEECVRSCACFANPDYGKYPCSERNTIRWYFSQYSGTCYRFQFSGCNEGNDNNFRSDLECQSACGPKPCDGPWCGDSYDRPMQPALGGQSPAPAAIGNAAPAAIGNARPAAIGNAGPAVIGNAASAVIGNAGPQEPAVQRQPIWPNAPQPPRRKQYFY